MYYSVARLFLLFLVFLFTTFRIDVFVFVFVSIVKIFFFQKDIINVKAYPSQVQKEVRLWG